MKVIVIGAGPAGLSCAYELSRQGVEVEVFEVNDQVGGMSRTIDLWGQKVDLGPHRFFSKEKRVKDFFHSVLKGEYTSVPRLTRIYYNKRYFNYPLKIRNVIWNLPLTTIVRVLWDYLLIRIKPIKNPTSFEEWVINRFGRKLYSIFFKSYSEKLWGVPCSEIDADWAAQRIKTFSLFGAISASLKSKDGGKHQTLIDEFDYPKNGTGYLYDRTAQEIEGNGGKVFLNSGIKRVVKQGESVSGVELLDGRLVEADVVVTTMPLTNLVKGFSEKDVPEDVVKSIDQLYFRNTILVYLEIEGKNLFEDNWIYIHSDKVKHGRITNFRNWCPTLNQDESNTILCLEFWTFDQDELWQCGQEELIALAKKEVQELQLFPQTKAILRSEVVKIPKCYPVYEKGYKKHLSIVQDYLDGIENLIPIGRYGSFKYNNQDHSILMGLIAADKILNNSKVNLWDVNTDSDYQEIVSETESQD